MEKPISKGNGHYQYKMRVKNVGYRSIIIFKENYLKLNLKAKVKINKLEIEATEPDLPIVKNYKKEVIDGSTIITLPFSFLNRKEYFDIHLNLIESSGVPTPQFEIRLPELKKGVIIPSYRRLRSIISKTFFMIGAIYPILVLFLIVLLSLITPETIRDFAKDPRNGVYTILIYFVTHYLFLFLGLALED